jgi:hypothetical protein
MRVLEIEASTRVDSPQVVMDRVRRPSTWPEWQSEIVTTEGPDELGVGDHVTGDARMLGFLVGGRADVSEVDEKGLQQDVIVGIRMKVAYSIAREGADWVVTHRLVADLPRGLSGRVLSFFLTRRLRKMQQELLVSLTDVPAAAGAKDSVVDRDMTART